MKRWGELDPEEKIEAAGTIRAMFQHPGWKLSCAWIEDRQQALQYDINTLPIRTESERVVFEVARQERVMWNNILKRPAELIKSAEGLLEEEATQEATDGTETK
jgi:hypothetical protein